MRDHSVPVERVVTATVLKFRRLSSVGYLSGTRIRFPTGCHLEYDVDLCAYFPEGMGRGLLLCRPLRPDSYSRIMALSQDGFVLLGSGVWCCPLSFSDGILVHLPRSGW